MLENFEEKGYEGYDYPLSDREQKFLNILAVVFAFLGFLVLLSSWLGWY